MSAFLEENPPVAKFIEKAVNAARAEKARKARELPEKKVL